MPLSYESVLMFPRNKEHFPLFLCLYLTVAHCSTTPLYFEPYVARELDQKLLAAHLLYSKYKMSIVTFVAAI